MSRTPEQKKSDAQEKRTAKNYNGSRTPMSGAGWKVKADVRTEHFMIENKTKMSPAAKSYSIKSADLRELTIAATLQGRMPLFQFDLGGHNYVVLNEGDFLDMIGADDDES